MPFDFEWKVPMLPTRSGVAQGHATERQMLEDAGGANQIKKSYRTNPDGSVTMAHMQNGRVNFNTVEKIKVALMELNYALRKWFFADGDSGYVASAHYTTELTLTTQQTIRFSALPEYAGNFLEYKAVDREVPTVEGLYAYRSVRAKTGALYSSAGALQGTVNFASANDANFPTTTLAWDAAKCADFGGLYHSHTLRTLPAGVVKLSSNIGVSGGLQLKPPSSNGLLIDTAKVSSLDTITRVGFARHGTISRVLNNGIATYTATLTNGATYSGMAPAPETLGRQPSLIKFNGLPTPDTTPEEAAAGLSWRNYVFTSFALPDPAGLEVQQNKLKTTSGTIAGNIGWLFRGTSGQLWSLKIEATGPQTVDAATYAITLPLRVMAALFGETTYSTIYTCSITIERGGWTGCVVDYYIHGVSSPDGSRAVLNIVCGNSTHHSDWETHAPVIDIRQYANDLQPYSQYVSAQVAVAEFKLSTTSENPVVSSHQVVVDGHAEGGVDDVGLSYWLGSTEVAWAVCAGYTADNSLYLFRRKLHEPVNSQYTKLTVWCVNLDSASVLSTSDIELVQFTTQTGYYVVVRSTQVCTIDSYSWTVGEPNTNQHYRCHKAISPGGVLDLPALYSETSYLREYVAGAINPIPIKLMWHPIEEQFYLYDPDINTAQVVGFF